MKKTICVLLCLTLVCVLVFSIFGCQKKETVRILYLGDSIAEALAGSSPVSERENYGYYALIGRCNEFVYHNRSVSGHRTEQLLGIIQKEDYGANMTHTLIKDADIIHISILGNDVLQNNFNPMLIEAAEDKYDKLNAALTPARESFAEIVDELKTLNPDAIIIFQTVYNPGDADTEAISQSTKERLKELGWDPARYRELIARVITRLNAVIWEYLEAHPGAFYISDVYSAFDAVYNADRDRGNRLIYSDWVHPSNYGHAIAALETQKLLQTLGHAHKDFLKNYKDIRVEQLERLYSGVPDVDSLRKSINKAETYEEVSKLYFDSTLGMKPEYC